MARPARSLPALAAMLLLPLVGSCVEAPTAPSDTLDPVRFARLGGGYPDTKPRALEPFLLGQTRLYEDEDLFRQCVVNPYEDLDGDDWVRMDRAGAFEQFFYNEHDAFVLVREAPRTAPNAWVPVAIGRAVWKLNAWYAVGSLPPEWTSIDSRVQGVVAPLDGSSEEVRNLLAKADPPDNLSGVPLGPGDPAVDAVDRALRVASDEGTLRGVDCEWNQGWKPFLVNEVSWVRHWPEALLALF